MNGFLSGSSKKPQKRALGSGKTVDVPLKLRLENLAIDEPSTVSAPSSESYMHLLLQVFHSTKTSGAEFKKNERHFSLPD